MSVIWDRDVFSPSCDNECSLSLATIHKALCLHQVKPLVKLKRKKIFNRYQRPIPGDRVQIDTCKIAPGLYQYTAVDDCSRWRVLALYKRRTATNTLSFIDILKEILAEVLQLL